MFLHNDGISEIVLLNLQEAYSLSVLMYASPALALQNKQINELKQCYPYNFLGTIDGNL